jgi:hypothetical protein
MAKKPPNSAKRLWDLNCKHISRDKMKNHKNRVLGKKSHKAIIMGTNHARGCGNEVRQLLCSDFEVLSFINPVSRMKFIKDTARVNIQQLTCGGATGWL